MAAIFIKETKQWINYNQHLKNIDGILGYFKRNNIPIPDSRKELLKTFLKEVFKEYVVFRGDGLLVPERDYYGGFNLSLHHEYVSWACSGDYYTDYYYITADGSIISAPSTHYVTYGGNDEPYLENPPYKEIEEFLNRVRGSQIVAVVLSEECSDCNYEYTRYFGYYYDGDSNLYDWDYLVED